MPILNFIKGIKQTQNIIYYYHHFIKERTSLQQKPRSKDSPLNSFNFMKSFLHCPDFSHFALTNFGNHYPNPLLSPPLPSPVFLSFSKGKIPLNLRYEVWDVVVVEVGSSFSIHKYSVFTRL